MSRIAEFLKRWRALPYIFNCLETLTGQLNAVAERVVSLERRAEFIQEALGRIETRQLSAGPGKALTDHEFRVFSQWGEDGIIQFLLKHVEIDRKVFVEFGVDNYNIESNTRFLLTDRNWTGLVFDGDRATIRRIKESPTYWLYNLKAVQEFITKDNINRILEDNGVSGEIGLLSIDIDGNDFWVWEAINVVSPAIVIAEYNYRLGREAVTIPYDEKFDRNTAHPSKLYFGASLKALCILANRKGYAFVGCNSNGVNAFFVRRDKLPQQISELDPESAFVSGSYGERMESNGEVVKISPEDEMRILQNSNLPLVHIE